MLIISNRIHNSTQCHQRKIRYTIQVTKSGTITAMSMTIYLIIKLKSGSLLAPL